MDELINFPNDCRHESIRKAILFELKRITYLIEHDETDPQVEYLFMTFKQGDDIIMCGAGEIPNEDKKHLILTLDEFLEKNNINQPNTP